MHIKMHVYVLKPRLGLKSDILLDISLASECQIAIISKLDQLQNSVSGPFGKNTEIGTILDVI